MSHKKSAKAKDESMRARAAQLKAARMAKRKARKEGRLPAQPGHLRYSRIYGGFV